MIVSCGRGRRAWAWVAGPGRVRIVLVEGVCRKVPTDDSGTERVRSS
jgi:hypothetical protein